MRSLSKKGRLRSAYEKFDLRPWRRCWVAFCGLPKCFKLGSRSELPHLGWNTLKLP